MSVLRIFLIFSIVAIYLATVMALANHGINWPVVFFGDLLSLDWRAQFNTDFLVHLFLLAVWVSWRERFTARGLLLGFLTVGMGGLFGFVYILVATYKAKGDPARVLLGARYGELVGSG